MAPLEGQQGDSILEAGSGSSRGAVAQACIAQDTDAAFPELPARRAQAGDLKAELPKRGEAPVQVRGLLGRRQLGPLLVAPGVEGDLVAATVDLAQQVGIDLRV